MFSSYICAIMCVRWAWASVSWYIVMLLCVKTLSNNILFIVYSFTIWKPCSIVWCLDRLHKNMWCVGKLLIEWYFSVGTKAIWKNISLKSINLEIYLNVSVSSKKTVAYVFSLENILISSKFIIVICTNNVLRILSCCSLFTFKWTRATLMYYLWMEILNTNQILYM